MITEVVRELLLFDKSNPINFATSYFWLFFLVAYALYSLVFNKQQLRNVFLFGISIFFYYKTSGLFFGLLLCTITSDFYIAKKIHKADSQLHKKLLLGWSVFFNLFILCYFKYAYFFTDSYNQIFNTNYSVFNHFAQFGNTVTSTKYFNVDSIILPVGISFYTFQSISYTVDVFRNKIEPLKRWVDFGFFVSFFPQLVAGPIVKASEFIPQMQKPFSLTRYQYGLAAFMILNGLLKKILVGDYMAVNFIDKVYANPLIFTGFENLMATIAYSLQVYLDFSGYTDIAIGISLLMGFRLHTNFNSPYKALNVAEFWKRWHISLSSWLQQYLYFPLGGNRGAGAVSYILIILFAVIFILLAEMPSLAIVFGVIAILAIILSKIFPAFKKSFNTNVNLMLTMLIGGLWHGSTWNFVIWGGLNGLGLVSYKTWKKYSPYEKLTSWPIRVWKIVLTFGFITFTRIFFRASDMQTASDVMTMITQKMDFSVALEVLVNFKNVFLLMLLGFVVHWLPKSVKWQYKKAFIRMPPYAQIAVAVALAVIMYQAVSAESVPFIYFQF